MKIIKNNFKQRIKKKNIMKHGLHCKSKQPLIKLSLKSTFGT